MNEEETTADKVARLTRELAEALGQADDVSSYRVRSLLDARQAANALARHKHHGVIGNDDVRFRFDLRHGRDLVTTRADDRDTMRFRFLRAVLLNSQRRLVCLACPLQGAGIDVNAPRHV